MLLGDVLADCTADGSADRAANGAVDRAANHLESHGLAHRQPDCIPNRAPNWCAEPFPDDIAVSEPDGVPSPGGPPARGRRRPVFGLFPAWPIARQEKRVLPHRGQPNQAAWNLIPTSRGGLPDNAWLRRLPHCSGMHLAPGRLPALGTML